MPKQKVVLIMGSKSDLKFAASIGRALRDYGVGYEYHVASAHRTPEYLLETLKEYEKSQANVVYVTVAGLSDALSGVVAGFTRYPVIACPPDAEKYTWPKVFSSVMTPKSVPVAFIVNPENAALMAVRILALTNPLLYEKIDQRKREIAKEVIKADQEVKEGKNLPLKGDR